MCSKDSSWKGTERLGINEVYIALFQLRNDFLLESCIFKCNTILLELRITCNCTRWLVETILLWEC